MPQFKELMELWKSKESEDAKAVKAAPKRRRRSTVSSEVTVSSEGMEVDSRVSVSVTLKMSDSATETPMSAAQVPEPPTMSDSTVSVSATPMSAARVPEPPTMSDSASGTPMSAANTTNSPTCQGRICMPSTVTPAAGTVSMIFHDITSTLEEARADLCKDRVGTDIISNFEKARADLLSKGILGSGRGSALELVAVETARASLLCTGIQDVSGAQPLPLAVPPPSLAAPPPSPAATPAHQFGRRDSESEVEYSDRLVAESQMEAKRELRQIQIRAASVQAARFTKDDFPESAKWMVLDQPKHFEGHEWHKHFSLRPLLPTEADSGEWKIRFDSSNQTGIPEQLSNLLKANCWDLYHKFNEAITPLDFYTPEDKLPLSRCSIKVGLATCLLNRGHQVKVALPQSIANMWRHREWAKIYLVDFGSTDGIIEWIKEHLAWAMGPDGVLRVFECNELGVGKFHISKAKNTAHRMAIEDGCQLVCNLDADNVTAQNFPVDIVTRCNPASQMRWNHYHHKGMSRIGALHYNGKVDGTFGRIALFAGDFEYLRGYDEDLLPAGGQDTDLMIRVRMLGRNLAGPSKWCSHPMDQIDTQLPSGPSGYPREYPQQTAIYNDKEGTTACMDAKYKSWKELDVVNRETIWNAMKNKYSVRNVSKMCYPYFGCRDVTPLRV